MPDDANKPDKKEDVTMPQVVAALKYVLGETQKVAKKFDDLDVRLRNQTTTSTAARTPERSEEKDVEAMTNSELTDHIVKQVSSNILTPLQKQISDLSTKTERDTLAGQIKEASTQYPDFWEFRDEIKSRIDANPSLSMDDAYTLARKDNKVKAEEIDKKRTEEAAAAKAAEDAKKPAFAGLLPTSSLSKPNSKMQPKDAAQAAWDETMAGVPSEMIN